MFNVAVLSVCTCVCMCVCVKPPLHSKVVIVFDCCASLVFTGVASAFAPTLSYQVYHR